MIQNEAAKRLAASFCIVPGDNQDMSCSYTGDNPRNIQGITNGHSLQVAAMPINHAPVLQHGG
jgi:hypothetical protein